MAAGPDSPPEGELPRRHVLISTIRNPWAHIVTHGRAWTRLGALRCDWANPGAWGAAWAHYVLSMIELVPDEHRWRQVMEIIKARILDGTYRPRGKVPGIRAMQQEFGVSLNTARHALNDLEEQGFVRQVPSIGTFVTPEVSWPAG